MSVTTNDDHTDRTDHTVGLLKRGYGLLPALRGGRSAVGTRLAGRPVLVVGGRQGVRLFYDTDLMRRRGAVPRPLRRTLFGDGAVHTLDGEQHRVRKAMFLAVASPPAAARLAEEVGRQLDEAVDRWQRSERVVVFDEAVLVLGRAAVGWAGVPVPEGRAAAWSRDLAAIVDGFGSAGPRHVRARQARRRSERWARVVVRAARQGHLDPPPGTALHAVVHHVDADGAPLDERTAAVELLNVVRPTVAVAWFAAFAALALVEQPGWRAALAEGDPDLLRAFVHEVRRRYPFVPALAARARTSFERDGLTVPSGRLVVLDVHGTDQDPAVWPDPQEFRPDRFVDRPVDPYEFVAQGGGDPATGHRCPGEAITVATLEVIVRRLSRLAFDVPEQDLGWDPRRMPTRPRSGVVLAGVRAPARTP